MRLQFEAWRVELTDFFLKDQHQLTENQGQVWVGLHSAVGNGDINVIWVSVCHLRCIIQIQPGDASNLSSRYIFIHIISWQSRHTHIRLVSVVVVNGGRDTRVSNHFCDHRSCSSWLQDPCFQQIKAQTLFRMHKILDIKYCIIFICIW